MWDGAGFFSFFGLLCGILIPQPEIKSSLPAVEAQSLNHLTTREIPGTGSFDHTMVGNVTPETYKGWRDFWSSLPSPAPQSLSLVCLELNICWESGPLLVWDDRDKRTVHVHSIMRIQARKQAIPTLQSWCPQRELLELDKCKRVSLNPDWRVERG